MTTKIPQHSSGFHDLRQSFRPVPAELTRQKPLRKTLRIIAPAPCVAITLPYRRLSPVIQDTIADLPSCRRVTTSPRPCSPSPTGARRWGSSLTGSTTSSGRTPSMSRRGTRRKMPQKKRLHSRRWRCSTRERRSTRCSRSGRRRGGKSGWGEGSAVLRVAKGGSAVRSVAIDFLQLRLAQPHFFERGGIERNKLAVKLRG